MRLMASLAALCATGCATLPPPPAGNDIYHYVRSNRDGSESENIVQFRPSPTQVAVYKWVEKCTTAAYVTADMDSVRWEPTRLDAGKVGRDGGQQKFGRLTLDAPSRTVSAWVDLPSGQRSDSAIVPPNIPWFLFDYDLGDLNAYLQQTRPTGEFMFAWALVWPEGDDFLTHMTTIHAAPMGIEQRDGRPARRFDLHFIAGKAGSGTLWTDTDSGVILEAEASVPNHPGMKDFRLKRTRVETGGQAAWDALMRAHYAGCPAGN